MAETVNAEDVLLAAERFLTVQNDEGSGTHVCSAYYDHYIRTLRQYAQRLPATIEPQRE